MNAKTDVIKEQSMVMQKEMIAGNYDALTSANETGRKVCNTFVPGNLNELIRSFGFLNNLPEINAINNGMRKKSGGMILDAEKAGHSEDVCTYVKGGYRHDVPGQHCAQRQTDAASRPADALLYRLLHLYEVVRTAAP